MNKELEFLEEKHGDNSWGHYPPSKREVAQWLQEWTEKQFTIHGVGCSCADKEKPTMEKYGWQSSNSFDEESGWMFEGGEDAYFEALKKWEALQ